MPSSPDVRKSGSPEVSSNHAGVVATGGVDVLILGCGVIGVLAGNQIAASGRRVLGVRRQPDPKVSPSFPIVAGDAAEGGWWNTFGARPTQVLLCANPGLRRGRDNRLAAVAAHVSARLPDCRLVYTGSTAVYADQFGAAADEYAAVDHTDPAVVGLLAIEDAVLRHANSLVLRVTALVGPSRTHARDRLLRGERTVRGNPDRPFSYLHEVDCAEIAVDALLTWQDRGILNVAAPERITVRDYYRSLATQAGLAIEITGDGTEAPARWIDAGRLQARYPDRVWRGVIDSA